MDRVERKYRLEESLVPAHLVASASLARCYPFQMDLTGCEIVAGMMCMMDTGPEAAGPEVRSEGQQKLAGNQGRYSGAFPSSNNGRSGWA